MRRPAASRARSPGGDGLAIWRAARDLGIAVSSPGSGEDFASPEFAALVEALPDLPIVIEHLAGGNRAAFALARFPNVYLKVPGLGEMTSRSADRNAAFPFDRSGGAIFAEALAAFGAQRLMWGSDFPVVCSREGYANALRFCLETFASCDPSERELIFGGVAGRVFFRKLVRT